jgi:hypothetical protein
MALRNAFDGVSTDAFLRRLLVQLHFAKTATDELRVVVDSGTSNVAINWANNGGYSQFYAGSGSPNSMDAREQMRAQSRANMQQVRATRWSIT